MSVDQAKMALILGSEVVGDIRLIVTQRDAALDACRLLDLAERNGFGHVIDVMPAVEAARKALALLPEDQR